MAEFTFPAPLNFVEEHFQMLLRGALERGSLRLEAESFTQAKYRAYLATFVMGGIMALQELAPEPLRAIQWTAAADQIRRRDVGIALDG